MLILAAVLYFTSSYGSSNAIPLTDASLNVVNDVRSFSLSDASLQDECPRKRIEIIWSCIATILASSWVSVHPNLPHPHDSKFRRTLRRIELMLWAIITPEVIVFWAMRQWYGARQMERKFSTYLSEQQAEIKPNTCGLDHQSKESGEATTSHVVVGVNEAAHESEPECHLQAGKTKRDHVKWTRTHGFFLQMGGFVLHENGRPKHILGWNALIEHYKAGRIDLSDVTEARINDHSKADEFAKGLALLQTLWFIVQCIARLVDDNLVLTQLELTTASLALLSLFVYVLWWNKPFNAEVPIVIVVSDSQSGTLTNHSTQEDNKEVEKMPSAARIKKALSDVMRILKRSLELLDPSRNQQLSLPGKDDLQTPTMRVFIFYAVNTETYADLIQMFLASFFLAALFGAGHCVAWSTRMAFSSHRALLMWRISSGIITGAPLIWILAYVLAYAKRAKYKPRKVLAIPFYIVSRIILLILSFEELRNVSIGALAAIRWTNFIPFIH